MRAFNTMAIAPTLFTLDVVLHHVDRQLEQELSLRVACHPSETRERMWLRVLAFAFWWEEALVFGPGLGEAEAPDVESKDPTGIQSGWYRVGKIEPAKLQRVVDQNGRAKVGVLFESPERMAAFLEEARAGGLSRVGKAELIAMDSALLKELGQSEQRRQKAELTIVGDHLYVQRDGESLEGPLTRGGL